jgi:hypothetical protein
MLCGEKFTEAEAVVAVPVLTVLACIETDFTGGGGNLRLIDGLCSGLWILLESLPLLLLLVVLFPGGETFCTFRLPLFELPLLELLLLSLVALLLLVERVGGLLSVFPFSSSRMIFETPSLAYINAYFCL